MYYVLKIFQIIFGFISIFAVFGIIGVLERNYIYLKIFETYSNALLIQLAMLVVVAVVSYMMGNAAYKIALKRKNYHKR